MAENINSQHLHFLLKTFCVCQEGKPLVLNVVRQAERRIVSNSRSDKVKALNVTAALMLNIFCSCYQALYNYLESRKHNASTLWQLII